MVVRVRVWSEGTAPRSVYPEDIRGAVAAFLSQDPQVQTTMGTFIDDDQGVSEADLANTDVLVWWGHLLHRQVQDATVERIVRHVRERGMGFVALHSAHMSRPFTTLIGTSGTIGGWKHDAGPEEIEIREPKHPVAEGVHNMTIGAEEMYDEPFDIGTPEAVVFHSSFPNGHQIRSGLAYTIGAGRVFYFRPGHEENPTYRLPEIQRVVKNAVYWTAKQV